jgi:hypothetical protein
LFRLVAGRAEIDRRVNNCAQTLARFVGEISLDAPELRREAIHRPSDITDEFSDLSVELLVT